MTMKRTPTQNSLYGTPSGLNVQNPLPIVAKRDPTTSDTGYPIGQDWINKSSGNVFKLAYVSSGLATWTTLGSVSSTFTTITAGTFATSTAATAISLASGNIFTGTGTNAAVGFIFTPKGAGGMTLTTGSFTLTSGNLTLTSGNVLLSAGTLTLTLGNATLTNGNLILGTAGKGIQLKSGANARIGQTTLVAGTMVVANSSVTANTRIIMTRTNKNAGTTGVIEVVPTAGVGFTVTALDLTGTLLNTDVSTLDWVLVESA